MTQPISDDKKTPWFSALLNPARAGWYEIRFAHDDSGGMRYFRGDCWFLCDSDYSGESTFGAGHILRGEAWRGLLERTE